MRLQFLFWIGLESIFATVAMYLSSRPSFIGTHVFAQAPGVGDAVGAATGILQDRSDAMIILVLVLLLAGLWLWKVHIPRQQTERTLREADKEIHRTNAATLEKLSVVVSKIHDNSNESNTTLKAMLTVKSMEIDCIENISAATGCDLTKPLSEMRGVLKAVENGATTGPAHR